MPSPADDSVTYRTLDIFRSYDCVWQDITASNMNEKAKALAYFCEKNGYYTASAVTDSRGELKFTDLEIGLYLVARTKTDPANRDFNTDPLLFFIPQDIGGRAQYDITATPKFSYTSSDDPDIPDTSDSGHDGFLPQTGQLLWPVTLLSVLGCFLILGGSFLLRKEGKREE